MDRYTVTQLKRRLQLIRDSNKRQTEEKWAQEIQHLCWDAAPVVVFQCVVDLRQTIRAKCPRAGKNIDWLETMDPTSDDDDDE